MSDKSARRQQSKHFFNREKDGSVRLRMRFEPDEASLMEEAAGDVPVMVWMHRTLNEAAESGVREARAKREAIPPPEE